MGYENLLNCDFSRMPTLVWDAGERRPPAIEVKPAQEEMPSLLDRLVDAVIAGDGAMLLAFCEENQEQWRLQCAGSVREEVINGAIQKNLLGSPFWPCFIRFLAWLEPKGKIGALSYYDAVIRLIPEEAAEAFGEVLYYEVGVPYVPSPLFTKVLPTLSLSFTLRHAIQIESMQWETIRLGWSEAFIRKGIDGKTPLDLLVEKMRGYNPREYLHHEIFFISFLEAAHRFNPSLPIGEKVGDDLLSLPAREYLISCGVMASKREEDDLFPRLAPSSKPAR